MVIFALIVFLDYIPKWQCFCPEQIDACCNYIGYSENYVPCDQYVVVDRPLAEEGKCCCGYFGGEVREATHAQCFLLNNADG